ncbi:hypothetical protein KY285_024470 [Solanum tuberosum]|nr:hypothetical protein KY285_024470 [Solanum tuberosum]
MIARKCDGLPLVLDLIGGVISRKEKKEALWLELLIFKTKAKALPPSFSNLCNLEILVLSLIRTSTNQRPDCSAEKICFPRLDVLNELEQLSLSASWGSFSEYTHGFPLSLKKMRLQWLSLTSDTLSRIGRLPNLQELILEDTIIEEGKEWNMEDVTFQNLKSLNLHRVEFSEWQVDAEKSFP